MTVYMIHILYKHTLGQYLANIEYYTNPCIIVIIIATIIKFLVTTLCQVIRLNNFPFIISFLEVFIHKQVLELYEIVFYIFEMIIFFLLSVKMVNDFNLIHLPKLFHSWIILGLTLPVTVYLFF